MATLNLQPVHKSLNAFSVLPNARYGDQEVDEHTILMLRAHPITQSTWAFNAVAVSLAVFIFDIFFGHLFTIRSFLWLNALAVIGIAAYVWYNFLLWYYTVGFVTNKRIIDVNYYGVIKRQVIETSMRKVSDVKSKTSGFFRQIINYGDLFVKTEGIMQDIQFDNIPDPDQALSIIQSIIAGDIQ